jgi:hypothetical protein
MESLLSRFREAMPELKLKPADDENAISWRAYYLVSTTRPEADLAEAVAKLVREFVAPETWTAKDTQAVIRALPDRIVVRQTLRVHREIAKLLNELELYSSDIPGRGPPMPP